MCSHVQAGLILASYKLFFLGFNSWTLDSFLTEKYEKKWVLSVNNFKKNFRKLLITVGQSLTTLSIKAPDKVLFQLKMVIFFLNSSLKHTLLYSH